MSSVWMAPNTATGLLTPSSRADATPYRSLITNRSSLVGYWRMDAVSGTTELDQTGNAGHGTIGAGVTLNQSGGIIDGDGAELLGGAGQFIQVPTASRLNILTAITVEMWIKFTVTTGFAWLVSKSSGGADGYELFRNNGTGAMRWNCSTASVSIFDIITVPTYADGAWHHVAGVYDSVTAQKATIYVDGASVITSGTVSTALSPDASDLFIGARGSSGIGPFSGSMDEVAIYNTALSATQIAADYRVGLGGAGIWGPGL